MIVRGGVSGGGSRREPPICGTDVHNVYTAYTPRTSHTNLYGLVDDMERHARCRHLNHRNVLARRLGPLEIHHARGEVAQLATLGDLDARLRDHLTYRVLLAELKNGEQSYELES